MKNIEKLNRSLLVSVSVPAMVLLSGAQAFAGDVTVSAPTTAGVVNADIAANPDTDIDLTVEDGGEIAGSLSIEAGSTTFDFTSAPPLPGETVETFSSSVIVDDPAASNITVENGGSVNSLFLTHNGSGNADITIDGALTGSLNLRGASNSEFTQSDSLAADGSFLGSSTTNMFSSVGPDVAISIGDTGALDASATSLQVDTVGNIDVAIDGEVLANFLSVTSRGQEFSEVSENTNTGFSRSTENINTGGDLSFNIGEMGVVEASNISLLSNFNAAFSNMGSVTGFVGISASGSSTTDSFESSGVSSADPTAMTRDTENSNSFSNSTESTGGSASFVNSVDALIDGSVSVIAHTDALADNSGEIMGGLSLNADGATSSFSSSSSSVRNEVDSLDADMNLQTSYTESGMGSNENSFESTGGNAAATNTADGVISSGVSVNADTDASFENAGTVTGFIGVTASGFSSVNSNENMFANAFDAEAMTREEQSSNSGTNSSENTGGSASFVNSDAALIEGSVSVTANTDATADNSGEITGSLNLNTNGTTSSGAFSSSSESSYTTTLDADMNPLTSHTSTTMSASESESADTGGNSTATNTADGVISSGVTVAADSDASFENAGSVTGFVSVRTNSSTESGSMTSTAETLDDDAIEMLIQRSFEQSSSSFRNDTGGDVSLTNEGSGVINGTVNLTADGEVNIDNTGAIFGRTTARNDLATASENSFSNAREYLTDSSDEMNTVTTYEETRENSNQRTIIRNDITGNYSGSTGSRNFTTSDGTVTQIASGNSVATVSGGIFGDLNSTAGSGTDTQSTSDFMSENTIDDEGNGSRLETSSSSSSSSNVSNSNSQVVITGTVESGTSGQSGSVNSQATNLSSVIVDGGNVGGDINSRTSDFLSTSDRNSSFEQTMIEFDTMTNAFNEVFSDSEVNGGGEAIVELLDGATVGGHINVTGVTGSSINIASDVEVERDIFVSTASGGTSFENSIERSYLRDPETGDVIATEIIDSQNSIFETSGDSIATIAGQVGGEVDVNASRGNASALITGTVGEGVEVDSSGSETTSSTMTTFTNNVDAPASSATNFSALVFGSGGNLATTSTRETIRTTVGGTADVEIDTAAEFSDLAEAGVVGNVSANGLSGANIDISESSRIEGSVSARSLFTDSVTTSVTTINGEGGNDFVSDVLFTNVGTSADITNNGTIEGNVFANGTASASVTNTGLIGSSASGLDSRFVSVTALTSDFERNTISSNRNNPALRNDVTTSTRTALGGDASFTNTATAILEGSVQVAGGTGTIVNDGFIFGTINAGGSVNSFTITEETTGTSTSAEISVPDALFEQAYTINQNNVSGGINIFGAMTNVFNPETGETEALQTSEVSATVNLNSGSVTLGNIDAQRDAETGVALTDTTVNLNGAGFWGLDVVDVQPNSSNQNLRTPRFAASPDLLDSIGNAFISSDGTNPSLRFGSNNVRGLGLTELNKEDDGVFVITGGAFSEPTAPGLQAGWTIDSENININGGELQLTLGTNVSTATELDPAEFGIRGTINNAATLVVGRRLDTQTSDFAQSIVQNGQQVIEGINLFVEGDYNQFSSGATVVGVNASLVRSNTTGVGSASAAGELLGPVTTGVSIPFFSVPGIANVPQSTPSHVEVDGDLNLDGTLVVSVTQDSLFVNGDRAEIFSYTGDGDVTATAEASIASNFVGFNVVHDTTAQTVSVEASRLSFASAADNVNAVSAATGFDGAFGSAVENIRSDALGEGAFASLEELGFAQDVANIASALDYRLSSAQASQVFDELSGGEVHGSISALNQSVISTIPQKTAELTLLQGDTVSNRVYFSPTVRNTTLGGGEDNGASDIDVDTFGGSIGADISYSPNGVFGIAFGFGEHDVETANQIETANVQTISAGAYAIHKFDKFYGSIDLSYSDSDVETTRVLDLLARNITSEYETSQWDGSLSAGYIFDLDSNWVMSPYVGVDLRSWNTEGFTEQEGGAIALSVADASNTALSPIIGGKVTTQFDAGLLNIQPYADLSYTVQGNINADRDVNFVANAGDTFTLFGVDPDSFGTIDAGLNAVAADSINVFAGIRHSFSGDNTETAIRGGAGFKF